MDYHKILRHIARLTLGVALILGLGSCLDNEPRTPENAIESKEHDDPVRAVFTLTEGTLRSSSDFDQNPRLSDFVRTAGSEQRISVVQTREGWLIDQGSQHYFTVKPRELYPDLVYKLHIAYYDAQGVLMNEQFATNGQDKIHQHFFVYYAPNLVRDESKLPYTYRYADEDASGRPISELNPMGFDGFLRFSQAAPYFKLSVELIHASESKLSEKDGKPSPYFAPTAAQRQRDQWDIKTALPIVLEGVTPPQDFTNPTIPDNSTPSTDPSTPSTGGSTGEDTIDKTIASAKLSFYEGHLHGEKAFHQNPSNPTTYIKNQYTVQLRKSNNGWVIDSSSPDKKLLVQSGGIYGGLPSPIYGLFVRYYNAAGQDITHFYAGEEANKQYQHFFTVQHVAPTAYGSRETGDDKTSNILGYVYADTTPWDKTVHSKEAKFNPEDNPVGFKGFLYFTRTYKTLDLQIELFHMPSGKLISEKPASYDAPPSAPQGERIISISIPVTVYTNRDSIIWFDDYDTEQEKEAVLKQIAEHGFTGDDAEANNRTLDATASAFGISRYEALLDMYALINNSGRPDNGAVWF